MTFSQVKSLLARLGHLGWIPPSERSYDMHVAHRAAMAAMPLFPLVKALPVGTKIMLTDLWKHAIAVKALGKPYTGAKQETGACVWAGAQNMAVTLLLINILQMGLQENFVLPFVLLAYGKSRQLAGMRGQGEGSLGSTMAQALRQFGMVDAGESGLPPYTTTNGYDWGGKAEMTWSDGASIAQHWLDEAKSNEANSAPLSNTQDLTSAVSNLCPCTTASMKWCQPGTEKLQGSGDNAAVIGTRTGTGGHQTSVLGVWNNPDLGLLFWRQNNWGEQVYQTDPSTGLGSGYWSPDDEEAAAMAEDGAEYFAFSGPMGFVSQVPTWRVI